MRTRRPRTPRPARPSSSTSSVPSQRLVDRLDLGERGEVDREAWSRESRLAAARTRPRSCGPGTGRARRRSCTERCGDAASLSGVSAQPSARKSRAIRSTSRQASVIRLMRAGNCIVGIYAQREPMSLTPVRHESDQTASRIDRWRGAVACPVRRGVNRTSRVAQALLASAVTPTAFESWHSPVTKPCVRHESDWSQTQRVTATARTDRPRANERSCYLASAQLSPTPTSTASGGSRS